MRRATSSVPQMWQSRHAVVGEPEAHLTAIEAGRAALFGDHKPADTLVGVESLAHPGCLIEVDAIAVVDDT